MGSRHPPAPPPIYHAGRGLFYLANFINCLIDIYSSGWFCLKRKPTNQPKLCLFVIRACDTFGEPGLVLTETGEPCPGLGLMPLSFTHLWFKSKFLRLTSLQPSSLSCSWTRVRTPAMSLPNGDVTFNCTNQWQHCRHLKRWVAGPTKRDTGPQRKEMLNLKLISDKKWENIRWAILPWTTTLPSMKNSPWAVVAADSWWNKDHGKILPSMQRLVPCNYVKPTLNKEQRHRKLSQAGR